MFTPANALRADPVALPSVTGVDLGDQGYAVLKVNKLISRVAPDDATAKQARSQYAQVWAAAENQAYYGTLRQKFNARITAPKVAGSALDGAAVASQ